MFQPPAFYPLELLLLAQSSSSPFLGEEWGVWRGLVTERSDTEEAETAQPG